MQVYKFVLLLIVFFVRPIFAGNLIRIVDEAANYGFGNDLIQPEIKEIKLVPRISPAAFSGPQHLLQLRGQCYDFISGKYKYNFCPFDNVTQSSMNQWPSYSGILGIWQGWEIKNNTFRAMLMANGDSCGREYREVKVTMSCNDTNVIAHVSEPKKCRYEMHFWTPLVCHPQALLVYPHLPESLRDKWDELLTRFMGEDITAKGYEMGLSAIFIQAGFQSPPSENNIRTSFPTKSEAKTGLLGSSFESLQQCQKEYEKLTRELDSLRLLLALNELPDED